MKYDFDKVIDRTHTDSLKWDIVDTKYPMWVADMDFETPPFIQEAIEKRVEQGVYGYSLIPNDFYKSIQTWWLERHGIGFDKKMMTYATGVIPALSTLIQRFTAPGDHVVIQAPVYHMFYSLIEQNGRIASVNELKYEQNSYFVDFEDLEMRLADSRTTLLLLCNPHNPTGNIWDRNTLEKIGRLCDKYHVLVISDEIHGDIVQPGFTYIPYTKVNETCFFNSITLVSASKAFNIAGLQSACVIIPNEEICQKARTALQVNHLTSPNAFACRASIAAFTEGEDWLDQMNAYIAENKRITEQFFIESIPSLKVVPGLATYLVWIDCSEMTLDTEKLCLILLKKEGIYLEKGKDFGKNSRAFLRMNVAMPRTKLLEALIALRSGLHTRSMRKYLKGDPE